MQVHKGLELFSEHTPPHLERLFGYQNSKRWVAFFWGKIVNHHASGYCFDGESFNPLNALAWDTFFGHPLVVAMNHKRIDGHAVKRFDFGDMHQTSRHFLLLDRQQNHLHAAQKPYVFKHIQMEIRSSNSQYTSSDFSCPLISWESEAQVWPSSKGALQMIVEMTAWLDARKAWLKKMGQWPKLN